MHGKRKYLPGDLQTKVYLAPGRCFPEVNMAFTCRTDLRRHLQSHGEKNSLQKYTHTKKNLLEIELIIVLECLFFRDRYLSVWLFTRYLSVWLFTRYLVK